MLYCTTARAATDCSDFEPVPGPWTVYLFVQNCEPIFGDWLDDACLCPSLTGETSYRPATVSNYWNTAQGL